MERSHIAAELEPTNGHSNLEAAAAPPQTTVYHLLLPHRWFLARCAAIALAVFTAIAFLLPPKYESVARLMPPDHNDSLLLAALGGRLSDSFGLAASSLFGFRSSGALFIGILGSNSVEDELIRTFDLRRVYGVRRWERARKRLDGYTDLSEDRKNGIITIRVRDGSRDRAQEMCRAYIDNLNRRVTQVTTSSARREREFLEERLKGVKLDLDRAAQDLSQFSSRNTAIDLPQQGKAMVEAAAMLQGQMIAAESELKGMEEVYGPEHVRVRGVQARIRELRRQLERLGGTDAQLAAPTGDSLYPPIRKLPLLALTYSDLYRRAKIQEAVYETLTKQYEMAKVQEAKETPTVRVLDEPTYPERHVSPPRLLIMLSGALLGFGIGVGLILGRVAWHSAEATHPRKVAVRETWEAIRNDWAACRRMVRRRSAA
jgi:capsule polysaccharide export protein KpsE/RkpR